MSWTSAIPVAPSAYRRSPPAAWTRCSVRGARGNIGLYAKVMRPFGRIAAIDDEWHLDWYVLKDKALSWEWEFMFARSKHHAADMVRQHDILEQIAHMIDAGDLVSTVTTRFEGIDAAHLRRAHALVETGHGIGKVVVGC